MIASWIAKRMIRSAFDTLSQDDFDVESLVARKTEDAAYGYPSDFGVGEIVKGKQASVEWLNRWKKEVPKRKFVVKSICFSAWPLSPRNVCMVDWTLTETTKEGQEFKYDGASVFDIRNSKMVFGADYISFKGLPKLSTLIKPTGKVQSA
jgi:ketosteroid isomerase-like protein